MTWLSTTDASMKIGLVKKEKLSFQVEYKEIPDTDVNK